MSAYPAAGQRCPRCRRRFRVLEDEIGMHDCPHCGYGEQPDDEPIDVTDETANVELWLRSDEDMMQIIRGISSYRELVEELEGYGVHETPDGVAYDSDELQHTKLDAVIADLQQRDSEIWS
jgi:Zn ribbon nucleic-acid-binding protein